jgi:hypothetical protein
MCAKCDKAKKGKCDGQPARAQTVQSKLTPSWPESVRLAHQAVVAFGGSDMINRAEQKGLWATLPYQRTG